MDRRDKKRDETSVYINDLMPSLRHIESVRTIVGTLPSYVIIGKTDFVNLFVQ